MPTLTGVLGRERVSLATRWGAPDPANPNFQALKLYTNYDGAGHAFAPVSVSATHNADPNLFSVYAATNSAGTSLTVMIINNDPKNAAKTSFGFNGFTPSQVTTYTLSHFSPNAIVAAVAQAWSSSMTFQPYTATLLVISGSTAKVPANEWDLNPDTIMVPAGGSVKLHPAMISGAGTVPLGSPTVANGGLTLTTTSSSVTAAQQGTIQVTAGTHPVSIRSRFRQRKAPRLQPPKADGLWLGILRRR